MTDTTRPDHAPLPLTVQEMAIGTGLTPNRFIYLTDANDEVIGDMEIGDYDEALATANLLARAANAHEELVTALEYIAQDYRKADEWDGMTFEDMFITVQYRAREILAKVKGTP